MNDVVKGWLGSAEMDLENIRVLAGNQFFNIVKRSI